LPGRECVCGGLYVLLWGFWALSAAVTDSYGSDFFFLSDFVFFVLLFGSVSQPNFIADQRLLSASLSIVMAVADSKC
jgi:hypothetical protein